MLTGHVTRVLRSFLKPLWAVPLLVPLVLNLAPAPAGADTSSQAKIQPALLAEMTANPLEQIPVIIEMAPATAPFSSGSNLTLAQQAVSILNTYGHAFGALSIIQGAAGISASAGITAMSLLPQVAAIEEDSVVRPTRPANSGPPYPPGQLTSLYPQEVNAPAVWKAGGSGRGVTVAVLDSGVANAADLGNGSRVLVHVGFAGAPDSQHPDPGGHGTHIAGTIAGDGTLSAGQYIGMAPKANIVDVQVLDAKGEGRISSVVRGIEWVLAHQQQFNIRVINMSFGAPPLVSYKFDPFAAAAEIAWRRGIVMVAASGNTGPNSGTVASPGIDPYVITIGATDDQATLQLSDDTLAWFSSWGTAQDSVAKPDLVAPGRKVVSVLVPGSTLDTLMPDHEVVALNGSKYFRLTGTSMSTAVVSGAVALVLEHQPALTPDQVKKILVSTTQPFGSTGLPAGAGNGLLNAQAAWNSSIRGTTNAGQRQADGLARTLYPIVYGQPLAWKSLTYVGTNWSGFTWLNLPWSDAGWDNIVWDNIVWDNIGWDNIVWDNIVWDQTSWDNIAWDNIVWDSAGWDNIVWDSYKYD
jgi:serine protease AprX